MAGEDRTYYYRAVALNPTGGGRSVNGSVSSFVTPGSGPPAPGVPTFVWLIIGGFVIVIIIVIILLTSRR